MSIADIGPVPRRSTWRPRRSRTRCACATSRGSIAGTSRSSLATDDPPRPEPAQTQTKPENPGVAEALDAGLPPELVPLHPRTAEERDHIEALRDYATARALENQGKRTEAIALYGSLGALDEQQSFIYEMAAS